MPRGQNPEAMKARREARAKAQVHRLETQKALAPLRDRVQAFIEEYERSVPFEHARRMNRLLHSVVRAAEMALEEAEKDLSRIERGLNPCRPSPLRQRLSDLVGGF